MPTSKNSTLPNLEDNLFSMSEKESSLLSEAIMTQTDVDCQLNDESLNIFEATTCEGAIDSVTLDDNGGTSSLLKRRRGKDKAASPERSRASREKRQIKQKLRKALSTPHSPQTRAKRTRLFARNKAGKPPLRPHQQQTLRTSLSFQIFYSRSCLPLSLA